MLVILLVSLCTTGAVGKRCNRVVPGLNRQARGVDVTKLDMMPLDPVSAEDGYKYPVISYTCDEGKTRTIKGVTYDIPDQVWIMSDIPSGSLSTTVSVVKTSSEAKKSIASNAGGGLDIWKFSFSGSRTYSRVQQSLARHEKIVEFVPAHFGVRRVDLHLEDTLSLGLPAQRRLERLPVRYTADPAGYEDFVRQFGTHYIAEAKFGGLIMMYMETNTDYLETHDEKTVEKQAGFSFFSFLSAKGGSTTTQSNVDTRFLQETTNITRYYGGTANLLDSSGLSAWQPTISETPWLFYARPERLSYLVRNESRREALDTAITDYVLRAYLTVELPRLIRTLPDAAQQYATAKTLLAKINTLSEQRPLAESDVRALGQEVENGYVDLFLEYHRPDDGFKQVNGYDSPFTFACPAGKTISRVESHHHNHYEDRQFSFGCSYIPKLGFLTDCEWTDYVNGFDGAFTFSCSKEGVLKGVSSYHDNHYEDRRFKFMCCQVKGARTTDCVFSDYVNGWDGNAAYRVSYSEEVIKGVSSQHHNHYEDRLFKFQKCKVRYYSA